jgi:hypothetical protein
MRVTLEGQKESTGPPRGGLGSALQPSGCSQATEDLTRVRVGNQPFVLAHSLAREGFMKQRHGDIS